MKRLVCLMMFVCCCASFVYGLREETFVYDDKGKRDPFMALVDKEGRYLLDSDLFYSSDKLKLTGILWDSGGRSSALINNQIMQAGESICGFEIKAIEKDSIVASKDGKEYTIRLSTEEKGGR